MCVFLHQLCKFLETLYRSILGKQQVSATCCSSAAPSISGGAQHLYIGLCKLYSHPDSHACTHACSQRLVHNKTTSSAVSYGSSTIAPIIASLRRRPQPLPDLTGQSAGSPGFGSPRFRLRWPRDAAVVNTKMQYPKQWHLFEAKGRTWRES